MYTLLGYSFIIFDYQHHHKSNMQNNKEEQTRQQSYEVGQMEEVDIEKLEHKLSVNKKQMLAIMERSLPVGVYAGEDYCQWQKFFQFYMDFMKAEIGPRGQCNKSVREQMAQNPQYYDQILSVLGVDHSYPIKDIYIRYKLYSPSPDYNQILKVRDTLVKAEDSFVKISDPNSIMYQKIRDGMLGKHGEGYNYEHEIDVLRESYKERIQKLKEIQSNLQKKLDQCDEYLRYEEMKVVMKPFFKQWRDADKRIGLQSIQKGDSFEKTVRENIMPIIFKRAGMKQNQANIKVVKNCRWEPKTLGEIDLAILEYNQEQKVWEAIVLIECKSRLFDVREAYKQVAVLEEKNKTLLHTVVGLVKVRQNYDYFIVTTLPQLPFVLPVESKMKEALQRSHKNKMIREIVSEEIYPQIRQKMQDELSPLDWFVHGDSDRIIVWSHN